MSLKVVVTDYIEPDLAWETEELAKRNVELVLHQMKFQTEESVIAATQDADIVVVAIGQATSLASLGTDLKINPRTLTTNLLAVYAGGDVVSGPSMVVKAMASGKSAARYIHRYLNSKPEYFELVRKHLEKLSQEEYRSRITVQKSHPPREVLAKERIKDFREIGRSYSQRSAQTEARRCVRRRVCSEYYDET